MGSLFSKVKKLFAGKKRVRFLCLGLDGAGKTTFLTQLKSGEAPVTIPTLGFNVEDFTYKNLNIQMWDIGGQHRIRKLWHHYYENTTALIYMVDSADPERMEESAEELHAALECEHLAEVPVLILANKQDFLDALTGEQVAKGLRLQKLSNPWYVQGTVATSGRGIYEGMEWLHMQTK